MQRKKKRRLQLIIILENRDQVRSNYKCLMVVHCLVYGVCER